MGGIYEVLYFCGKVEERKRKEEEPGWKKGRYGYEVRRTEDEGWSNAGWYIFLLWRNINFQPHLEFLLKLNPASGWTGVCTSNPWAEQSLNMVPPCFGIIPEMKDTRTQIDLGDEKQKNHEFRIMYSISEWICFLKILSRNVVQGVFYFKKKKDLWKFEKVIAVHIWNSSTKKKEKKVKKGQSHAGLDLHSVFPPYFISVCTDRRLARYPKCATGMVIYKNTPTLLPQLLAQAYPWSAFLKHWELIEPSIRERQFPHREGDTPGHLWSSRFGASYSYAFSLAMTGQDPSLSGHKH